jgi:phage tail sheath protein FI
MTSAYLGFSLDRSSTDPRAASNASMSVIGLAGPIEKATKASQADFDAAFELGKLKRFNSTDKVAALISPDCAIGRTLSLINAQLADYQMAALVVLLPTEEGDDDAETIANIIGNASAGTGIHAFKRAGADVGVYPRLIGVPGYTTQTVNHAKDLTLVTAGSNMTVAPTVGFTGGGSAAGKVLPTAHAVLGTGADAGKVVNLVLDTPGSDLSGSVTVTFTGGGTDAGKVLPTATIAVDTTSNAVVAALPAVLNAIKAKAYVAAPGVSYDGDLAFRETVVDDSIAVMSPNVKVMASDGTIATADPVGIALGLHVAIDFQNDGRPFGPICNRQVNGIVGVGRAIPFHLLDGSYEGQQLLANQIGPIVRGEAGDDFAISDGGYVFLGFEVSDTSSAWVQMHAARGRDFTELTLIRTVRYFFGKYKLTTQMIKSVIDTMKQIGSTAAGRGEIYPDFVCRFDPDLNNVSDLGSGIFHVDYRAQEVPMFRKMGLTSRPYQTAITKSLAEMITDLG